MILLIDNFDSFVYNLARYFQELGNQTLVKRNDAVSTTEIRRLAPEAIVISPGPCDPPRAGVSLEVVRELGAEFPILGICLGHQVIGAAYGGTLARAVPCHGRTSEIHHHGEGIFRSIPSPLTAARYHSLVVSASGLPSELAVCARTGDDLVMGLSHREHLVVGVQFHPESVLTQHGHQILANFLQLARMARSGTMSRSLSP